ncbi:hypothetical protein A3Q56_00588 [Intoshia linei]|uniref:U4/U6.U5 tri-snRNP-associated protein 1 n=1 Tax=Intoshia linei TaxID=1819745 RepID=A0A177BDI6_9BILA|nr:hypothetical protein A3Q56_00588 [Intoshia linei]
MTENDNKDLKQYKNVDKDKVSDKMETYKTNATMGSKELQKDSLSIQDTNKLRAKLGLKPLDTSENTESGEIEYEKRPDVHTPAVNFGEKVKSETIKEKLEQRQERRRLMSKAKYKKSLGEGKVLSAAEWIAKNRIMTDKREKEIAEMEKAIEESTQMKTYDSSHLTGLTIAHDENAFKEGINQILTLKDRYVLDEDDQDVLVNVNIVDDEKAEENIFNKKHTRDYNPYDDNDEKIQEKKMLSKYDDRLYGKKIKKFTLEDNGVYSGEQEKIKKELEMNKSSMQQSLELPPPRIMSDYMTHNEMLKFKKIKRKVVKKRRRLKADDLLDDFVDVGVDEKKIKVDVKDEKDIKDVKDLKLDDRDKLNSLELCRLNDKKTDSHSIIDELMKETENVIQDHPNIQMTGVKTGNVVFEYTSEFCKSLNDDIYSKNLPEKSIIKNDEKETSETKHEENVKKDTYKSTKNLAETLFVDEASLGGGAGKTLRLAAQKGYLDKTKLYNASTGSMKYLEAKNFSIETKRYEETGNRRNSERYGAVSYDFRELNKYKPTFNLTYFNEHGMEMDSKEAFRYLSHKFHGKGSGVRKIQKRTKKRKESLMMQNSVASDEAFEKSKKLSNIQKQKKSPFLMLGTSDSK